MGSTTSAGSRSSACEPSGSGGGGGGGGRGTGTCSAAQHPAKVRALEVFLQAPLERLAAKGRIPEAMQLQADDAAQQLEDAVAEDGVPRVGAVARDVAAHPHGVLEDVQGTGTGTATA